MRIAPAVSASVAMALFITAAEAEMPVRVLTMAWLSAATAVLALAICRFVVLGPAHRAKYCCGKTDKLTTNWITRCDEWGIAFTIHLVVTGVFLLYLLD